MASNGGGHGDSEGGTERLPIKSDGHKESYGISEMESYSPPEETSSLLCVRWSRTPVKRRYIVASLAFFGFCVIYMLRVNLSVAVVAMMANKTHENPEDPHQILIYPDFTWDSKAQGVILSSFFYGYIVTQLPGGFLATKYGGKMIFLIGIGATSILTLATPFLAKSGTGFLITTRILEGLFEGITYPSIHAIWARWAPPLERTRLAAVAFSGSYVGTVIALPLSGLLAQYLGWEWIFYFFGIIGIGWCFAWWYIVKDSPEEDRHISDQELEYLRTTIGMMTTRETMTTMSSVPWKAMLTSKAVWAIIVAHFAENWGFYTLLTGLPKFLTDVLHFKLDASGFLAAFPYLLMAGIVQSAGIMADYARTKGRLSTTLVRKIFTCGSYACQTTFMTLTALLVTSGPMVILCISLSLGCGGFAWAGFSINHLDIAPQYAAILMGISNTIGTIPGIISPLVTGFIVQDGSPEQWQFVFLLTASIYLFGALFYAFTASGERQEWSKIEIPEETSAATESDAVIVPENTNYGTS